MATRGAVASGTLEKWTGVYNHWDSYPSGLGAEVWSEIIEHGIDYVATNILKYGDWREYKNNGICEYCGKKTGRAHSISLLPGDRELMERGEYPDPEALRHEHRDFKEDQFTSDNITIGWMEWLYIIDKDKNALHCLANIPMIIKKEGKMEIKLDDSNFQLIETIEIDPNCVPDWESIEKKRNEKINDIYEKVAECNRSSVATNTIVYTLDQ